MQTIMFRNMRNKHILCVHTSLYTCIYSIYSVVSPVGTLSISQYSQTWGCFHMFFVSKKNCLKMFALSTAHHVIRCYINCKSRTALSMSLIDVIVPTAPQDRTGMST